MSFSRPLRAYARREPAVATHDGLAEVAREGEAFAGGALGADGHHHVQPAPSRRLDPRFEAQRGQRGTEQPRSFDHLRERHRVARIEIEHDPIGKLDVLRAGVPGVDLGGRRIIKKKKGLDGVGDEVLAELGLLRNSNASQRGRRPDLRVPEEDASLRDLRPAAHQLQGPSAQVGEGVLRDALVVADQVELGQPRSCEHGARGVADADAGDFDALTLADHLLRLLVVQPGARGRTWPSRSAGRTFSATATRRKNAAPGCSGGSDRRLQWNRA